MNKTSLGFIISLALTTVFIFSAHLNNAVYISPKYHPVADLNTTWINKPTVRSSTDPKRAAITPVLSLFDTSPFISGFYCFSNETSCFFGIIIFTERNRKGTDNSPYYEYTELADPQLVWSANRDRPVQVNATLNFTANGNLILKDADGDLVWSTNTRGKFVTGLGFTEVGNLVLFDSSNAMVWQSFDYPTDSLLIGQKLVSDSGQKLIARTSSSNFSRGLFSLSVQQGRLLGYMEANPPLVYYNSTLEANPNITNSEKEYVAFENGSFNGQDIPLGSTTQFMRLEPDGHLKVYQGGGAKWKTVEDLLKVQNSPTKQPLSPPPKKSLSPPRKKSRNRTIILGSSLGALCGACLLVGSCIFGSKMKREQKELDDEFSVDKVPGMPTRFSYDDLKIATNDFNNQLGKGGFGSVFQGTLRDGTQVAVKRLNGSSQINKSFLAEVQTIGNIHHVNLVRLIGFCAENSNRLLVYEYMSNGSLDRWIFERHQELTLGWESRRKIIVDIAKGLAYLHEECRQKIYHLDVKPQNILLDENFEAKVSDFGLAKLIDKDQSKVVATLGGTPGYMAPEWLSSIITEKVDVYSFGVVVLEILCGRKNLDRSQPEEEMHLLGLFERKGEEGQLLDMVDKSNADMQLHRAEVVEMMKLTVWCLQSDYQRRPSMTVVVQVLEGLVSVQDNLDYNFINAPTRRTILTAGEDMDAKIHGGTILSASVLSGPR